MSLFDLTGHVAIITGGNGGIGLGMALGLAKAGASLAIVGRNSDKNKIAIEKLQGMGATAIAIEKDITEELAGTDVVTKVEDRFGRIDILINNAGNNIPEHFTKVKKENMEYLVELNMKAAFNIAQICSQKMLKLKIIYFKESQKDLLHLLED